MTDILGLLGVEYANMMLNDKMIVLMLPEQYHITPKVVK